MVQFIPTIFGDIVNGKYILKDMLTHLLQMPFVPNGLKKSATLCQEH